MHWAVRRIVGGLNMGMGVEGLNGDVVGTGAPDICVCGPGGPGGWVSGVGVYTKVYRSL